MNTYVAVNFGLGAVALVLRLGLIMLAHYPRTQKVSMRVDFVEFLVCLGFVVWAGILLWGKA